MENPQDSSSVVRRQRRIQRKTKPPLPNESSLPDDIITDILSWLPAKDVLRSQCVCPRWTNLTSTEEFTELHRRRSFSMILKDCLKERVLLDRCWEPNQTKSKIHKVFEPSQKGIDFSHNGLLVTSSGDIVQIYNPIYHAVVSISIPNILLGSAVYGVFFHPVQKEYCTLWQIVLSAEPMKVQYKILNLESNPHWRDIKNPCNLRTRVASIPPILIDEYLYWMVAALEPNLQTLPFVRYSINCDIMEYDIKNEEFRVIPCPVLVTVNGKEKYNVNLVDIDGVVSLVQIIATKVLVEIDIWTLKNHREQMWTSSHYNVPSGLYRGYGVPKAIACRDGELFIQSLGRLYVYNLKLGTYRKFGKDYNHDVKFFPHVTSLVSVKNCKSKILMLDEDENYQRDDVQALEQFRW